MERMLSDDERKRLLGLARDALSAAVRGDPQPPVDLGQLPQNLRREAASFVTLTRDGELRGCIGSLEPRQPLALDVREHAIAAALEDYRFPPVQPSELPDIRIEISVLTLPEDLEYHTPQDLVERLRIGVDGVTLMDGWRRATFLPQVWMKLPTPDLFLSHLCQKMGSAPDAWKRKKLHVQTYRVEEFQEETGSSTASGCLDEPV